MPNPRRRHSRARGRRRRTHWKAVQPVLGTCPQCKAPKEPHRICRVCGTYDGRPVFDFEAERAKKAEKKKKKRQ
ncbi:MAG: 50S ribosomal protein L32 [Deltaproteobacteria bacterium]